MKGLTCREQHWRGSGNEGTSSISFAASAIVMEAVDRLSREGGTSINPFVATAVAEKVSALQTARYLADRKARADFKAFDEILRRRGGEPPRAGDELPPQRSK
jgi:hypothetical protein